MTRQTLELDEDLHVHSRFSDGVHTLYQNVLVAESLGLKRLGCVDHVRQTTRWVPDFVQAVRELSQRTPVQLLIGVEAKILNASGALDVPKNLDGVDRIYVADHQFPLQSGCCAPQIIRELMTDGGMSKLEVFESLVGTIMRVMERYPGITIAHLFSILPKLRLSESQVPDDLLAQLADCARRHGVVIEVDERWRCPSERTLRFFARRDVPIVASSDAHRREGIARYDYVATIAQMLEEAE